MLSFSGPKLKQLFHNRSSVIELFEYAMKMPASTTKQLLNGSLDIDNVGV